MQRFAMFVSAASAAALLSGCGGGGGGGGVISTPAPPSAPTPTPATPTPTPAPTPTPTPANTSLIDLTQSETFTNDAATGAGAFYTDARVCACTAANSTLNFRYDAGSQSYTVSLAGRSQTFTPADFDAAQSSAALKVYTKVVGARTESLSLTRPGESGALTYKYVGGGYWQRATTSGDHVDFTFDAFTYGVKTPDAALPRTGSGVYAIDVIGALGWGTAVGLAGSGTLQVDLASGDVIAQGTITLVSSETGATIGSPGGFLGLGKVSSSANAFNGSFSFEASVTVMTGTMTGRFYGPNAEEIGAVFATSYTDGRAAVGTITGRKTGTLGGDTSFDALTHSQLFTHDAAISRATYAAAGPTGESAGTEALIVDYNAATGRYILIAPDRSAVYNPGTYGTIDTLKFWSTVGNPYAPGAQLHYVRGAEWTLNGGGSRTLIDDFTFGFATPGSAVPRMGMGYYAIGLVGVLSDSSQNNAPLTLSGDGLLTADFSAGTVGVSGGLSANYLPLSPGRAPVLGTFSGTAAIASGSNGFGGSFGIDVFGHFAGAWNGRFYGPNAEEVGAAFYGVSGAGHVASGSIIGKSDPAIAAASHPLASLTDRTTFAPVGSHVDYSILPSPYFISQVSNYADGVSSSFAQSVTWDPAAATYSFATHRPATATYSVAAADRDAGASNARFTAYHRVEGDKTIDALVYNNTTAPLQLTYTSFASLLVSGTDRGNPTRSYDFMPFGLKTPAIALPRVGTATYDGIVYGRAIVDSDDSYTLGGTSHFAVDFYNAALTADLVLTGTNAGGTVNFGTYTFLSRFVANDGFEAQRYGGDPSSPAGFDQGTMEGSFFGLQAEEIGAAFTLKHSSPSGSSVYTGVTVGKKGP